MLRKGGRGLWSECEGVRAEIGVRAAAAVVRWSAKPARLGGQLHGQTGGAIEEPGLSLACGFGEGGAVDAEHAAS